MEKFVTRNFRARGEISCLFEPGVTPETTTIRNIEVQLWQKSPMDVVLLGKGFTDAAGEFIIDVKMDSPAPIIEDGEIKHVFLMAYYNGKLLTGDNPYL